MFHNDNVIMDIEDLLMDFLAYRQNKRDCNCIKTKSIAIKEIEVETESIMQQLPEPMNPNLSEFDYIKMLYSQINKELESIIDEVLDEYEYDGSPTLEEQIDRETLGQIISRVIEIAMQRIEELKDMPMETQAANWSRFKLFSSLVEVLVLMNLYLKRHHKK